MQEFCGENCNPIDKMGDFGHAYGDGRDAGEETENVLKIMISPAKKMNVMEEAPADAGVPRFLERTKDIKNYLQSLDYGTLKEIWKCNDKLAQLNFGRLREMELDRRVTPAVFAYEGIQYQCMAPMVFEQKHLDYIETHLYILSGFYGILKAFDGVVPYRLEMQARLSWKRKDQVVTSLYDYWGSSLYEALAEENPTIINLASQEYARAVLPWKTPQVRFVECVFGEWDGQKGKVRVKATAAKMARGAMVRYMAEHQVDQADDLKLFDLMGYKYREELSGENTFVFVTGNGK